MGLHDAGLCDPWHDRKPGANRRLAHASAFRPSTCSALQLTLAISLAMPNEIPSNPAAEIRHALWLNYSIAPVGRAESHKKPPAQFAIASENAQVQHNDNVQETHAFLKMKDCGVIRPPLLLLFLHGEDQADLLRK